MQKYNTKDVFGIVFLQKRRKKVEFEPQTLLIKTLVPFSAGGFLSDYVSS